MLALKGLSVHLDVIAGFSPVFWLCLFNKSETKLFVIEAAGCEDVSVWTKFALSKVKVASITTQWPLVGLWSNVFVFVSRDLQSTIMVIFYIY